MASRSFRPPHQRPFRGAAAAEGCGYRRWHRRGADHAESVQDPSPLPAHPRPRNPHSRLPSDPPPARPHSGVLLLIPNLPARPLTWRVGVRLFIPAVVPHRADSGCITIRRNAMSLASRFAPRSPVLRSDRPLLDDQIRAVVPSIFAETPHESRSQRYSYIPTATVLSELRPGGVPALHGVPDTCPATRTAASTPNT